MLLVYIIHSGVGTDCARMTHAAVKTTAQAVAVLRCEIGGIVGGHLTIAVEGNHLAAAKSRHPCVHIGSV